MLRLNSFFLADSTLRALSDDANNLSLVQKVWANVVPKPFVFNTRAGIIQHKRLTVYTSNGAIASKIKLMMPSLIKQLQNQGLEVTSIRIQVQVESQKSNKKRPQKTLPIRAINSIDALANSLDESPLKASLQRLAKHAKVAGE